MDKAPELDRCQYNEDVIWPKISIVTPSYNQGKYIEETILSVIMQNYPNLEYIIIDGGSTDETVDIIKKYEPWITYWESAPDYGQSHAINKGLKKCTGEIFNWLNSDDWYLPNTLFEIARQFNIHKTVQVVSGLENHVNANGEKQPYEGTLLAGRLEETIEQCQIAQPSTFFKMSAFKELGTVPEDMHFIMDGELWVRFLLLYGQEGFCKIYKPLVNFRLHENSKTTSNAVKDNFLLERSSIIVDLQKFIGLPPVIINYWNNMLFNSSGTKLLNRNWKINESVISRRQLRSYFIKKFINYQFQNKDLRRAILGLKLLIKDGVVDAFVLRSVIKLVVKAL